MRASELHERSVEVSGDLALVRRTLVGDLDAFERLVEEHRDVVFRVAARIVGPEEAEDVAQDSFLRAFHRLSSYRDDAPFRVWLLRIVHNTALNAAQRRRPEPSDGVERELVLGTAEPPPPTPSDELETSERRERMRAKLSGLRPHHRSVLVLRELEGMSYEEIAEITNAPLGSVKGRLHRARAELVDLLRHNAYDWGLPDE